MKGLCSRDFEDRMCNCNKESNIDRKCLYTSDCSNTILVYNATYKDCKCYNIGNTQQHTKKRMNQHISKVRNLVNKNITSDSFAKHIASYFPNNNEKKSTKDVREKVAMEILDVALNLSENEITRSV